MQCRYVTRAAYRVLVKLCCQRVQLSLRWLLELQVVNLELLVLHLRSLVRVSCHGSLVLRTTP